MNLNSCRRHTAIIHYSLFIIHWGGHRPSFCLPLKLRKGKTFRSAFTLTDTFLASARPVDVDETVASGTGKPVPYKVRCKIQQRTCVTRGSHGFLRTLDTGLPEINVSVGASKRLQK